MLVAALALLASSAFAAPAFAGEAVVESFGTVVAYRDANDDGGTRSGYDDNDVSITSPSFGKYVIADATDEVVAGAGCVALDAHRAECTDIRITMIYVQLEAGDDRLDVGTGTRTEIWAGSGRDVVNGGSGPDEVHGDARCPGGSDDCNTYLVSAAPLWDTIDGRGGNDLIYGDDSRRGTGEPLTTMETLLGGSGNDTIHGGPVSDTLFADKVVRGGPGADTLVGDWGQLDYSDYTGGVNVSTDGNANDGLVGEGDNVQGFWGTILGTPGNDTLSGGQTLYGFAGQDALLGNDPTTFTGADGANFLFGGPGTDLLVGEGGPDFLYDGGGTGDILRGGAGGDTADYSDRTASVNLSSDDGANDGEAGEGDNLEGVEFLTGGAGNDVLTGSAATNRLEGGPGDDLMSDGGGNFDTLKGGPGFDAVDYMSRTANISLSDDGSFNDGEPGEQDFVEAESLNAGSGNDTLIGGSGANDLWGGAGADLLRGGGGGDRLFGGSGNDTADYGWCTCTGVIVDLAADTGTAGGFTDLVVDIEGVNGSPGADTLLGDPALNLFDGKNGADVFDGRGGGDLYTDTGADVDTVTYASRSGSVTVSLDGAANDGEAGESDNVGQAIENVIGGSGDDTLTGSLFANVLTGGAGEDMLSGGDGNDTLNGGDDADGLFGGAGADALEGGRSADEIQGGAGLDTVDYTGHEPAACSGICPFDPRGPGVEVSLDDVANDGNLGFDSPCCSVPSAPLPAGDNVHSDVDVVIGTSGPDTLTDVETGAHLKGMAGDDRLVDGRGATIFEGGAGTDTADYSGSSEARRSITLDGVANDGVADSSGASLENDDVRTDVENIVGGPGPDAIGGSDAANRLTGGPGIDSFDAGEGDDVLNSRDSAEEAEFDCGPGTDTVVADTVDRIEARAACELVQVEAPDTTPPAITANVSGTLGDNGWYTSDVTVTWSVADGQSAISSSTGCGATTISADTAGTTLTCSATSAGGTASSSVTIKRDATAPTSVATSLGRLPDSNGWYNAPLGWTTAGEDATSGIASCDSGTYAGPDSVILVPDLSVSGKCTDNAGNESAGAASALFKYDDTDPVATTQLNGPPDSGEWYTGPISWGVYCTDHGSGIAGNDVGTYSGPDGNDVTVSGRCWDNAGNYSALDASDPFDYDGTGPVIVGSASPAAKANGWNNTPVTVSFSCSDDASGVASCEPDKTLASEGVDQSASGGAVDNVGHLSMTTVAGIDIDLTDPSVDLVGGPADGATYDFGSVPSKPTCAASDPLSGLDGACSVSGYSTSPGTYTVTAMAKDKAGNEGSESRTYTVRPWTLLGFYQPTDMSGVLNVVKNGATVPLRFELFAGSTELTDATYVMPLTATRITCETGATVDAVEVTATGATGLRYDAVTGEFVYNWHTPKKPGNCYRVTITTQDGSSLAALFKLK